MKRPDRGIVYIDGIPARAGRHGELGAFSLWYGGGLVALGWLIQALAALIGGLIGL